MENFKFIEKAIEEDVLFYVCDWSLHQNISQDNLVDTADIGSSIPVADLPAEVDAAAPVSGNNFLPSYVCSYFDGVLQNIGDTEYYAYCYDSHYFLVYNLQIENDVVVPGEYPLIEIYQDLDVGGYTVSYSITDASFVPGIAYASYGTYSDLRTGLGHTEVYTILFAIGFAVVYAVVGRLFSLVMNLRKK